MENTLSTPAQRESVRPPARFPVLWTLAAAAVATILVYTVFTVIVTEWRNALRRSMNEADTELRAISMDTLTNFETFKAFGAETRESDRYDGAMQTYNDRYVRTMQSLAVLNAGQELVMTAGLLAVALLGSRNRHYKRQLAAESVDADGDGIPDVFSDDRASS